MSDTENVIKRYMRLACPGCQEKLKVETKFSLKKHICEHCSTKFYVPEVFGPYQLTDIASNDETTSTHHAVNLDDDTHAVIRRLRPEFKLDGTIKKVFFEESDKLAEIQLDTVVKISHCGDVDGIPYIVYAHYGESCLKRKLRKNKYSLIESCYMFLDILGSLEPCHEQSLIHGNLKPSNIRYDEHDNVRILDLGMSAALVKCMLSEKDDIKLYNNPYYIAPETVKSGEITPVSDIYCLGSMLYEMISGKKPFESMTAIEAMVKKQHDLPEPPNHLKPGVPPMLNSLIMGMIDITPARRPQFIVQVVAILQKIIEELEEKEKTPEMDEKEATIDQSGGYSKSVLTERDIPAFELPQVEEKKNLFEKYGVQIGIVFVLIVIVTILSVLYFGSAK